MTERNGTWMQTFTGKAFWPLDPRPEDIDIRDIAHSLSMICRYGGHTKQFYSVAQHCVLMSWHFEMKGEWELAKYALLHDATEAYVGDMIRPLKRSLPEYRAVEDRLMAVILEWAHLKPELPEAIHRADNAILVDERTALMEEPPMPWLETESRLFEATLVPWGQSLAEQSYLVQWGSVT